MNMETALPTAPEATASGQQTTAELPADTTATSGADDAGQGEGEGEQKPPKAEKTEAEREADRLRRAIDRKTRQREEARAEAALLRAENERLRTTQSRATNTPEDEEPLTLSRAELAQMVKSEAEKLAPTLKQKTAEIEHQEKVVESLRKELGNEGLQSLIGDLNEAFDGALTGNKPCAAADAIFDAEDPQAVIKYLADPENADEAEAISRMNERQAGRAIAKLEIKLEQSKAAAKPQRSKAPEPVEPARGSGAISTMPDPSNTKAWIRWRNEEERAGR
jgi:hypothetical protein